MSRVLSKTSVFMTYEAAPSADDLKIIADECLQALPSDLTQRCTDLAIGIEEFPDEALEAELNLEDAFSLLALYLSPRDVAPGVTRKQGEGHDRLILYRRPLLDLWCESGEDLLPLVRRIIIEEIAQKLELTEAETAHYLEGV